MTRKEAHDLAVKKYGTVGPDIVPIIYEVEPAYYDSWDHECLSDWDEVRDTVDCILDEHDWEETSEINIKIRKVNYWGLCFSDGEIVEIGGPIGY